MDVLYVGIKGRLGQEIVPLWLYCASELLYEEVDGTAGDLSPRPCKVQTKHSEVSEITIVHMIQ